MQTPLFYQIKIQNKMRTGPSYFATALVQNLNDIRIFYGSIINILSNTFILNATDFRLLKLAF